MTPTQKEIEQNIDWLKSHYYSLLKRVEELERRQLTVAVGSTMPAFDVATHEVTGETL